MSLKVGMVSLGCPKNQVDAEILLKKIKDSGFTLEPDSGNSDVIIINTCGFIESAKQEAIENILEFITLKNEGRIKKIIVTGCLAERYREEIIEEMPEVDAVVGIGSNGKIIEILKDVLNDKKITSFGDKTCLPLEGERLLTTLPFYAYIKIAEGCDNRCSYCAIPDIRGKFRSRPIENIVNEAKTLAQRGVKELIVVAQDTTRYGEDLYGEYKLAKLLRELCKIDGFKWIRVLYAYPERITDELLEVIATEEKIAKYLDMPIQHCNGEVLKNMNRPGNREKLEALIKKIREKVPGITLRTTLIAGFPGETDEQFEELCEFAKEMDFERLGCFAYSPEENTKAGEMENQLSEDVKSHRAEIITDAQITSMIMKDEEKIGKTVTVVTEGFDRLGECYFGRSESDAPEIDGKIFFTSDKKLEIGDFTEVLIEDTLDVDLLGSAVN